LPGAGPCGPCTEQFFWRGKGKAPKKFEPNDSNWIEIGNDVLMQYIKDNKGNFSEAKQKNIDFGGGVERTLAVLNGFDDNYLTDVWKPIIKQIEKLSNKKYSGNEREMRIIADHIKAAVFIIADGITPSNTERGYVLRRLIRRAIRYGRELGLKDFAPLVAEPVFEIYDDYDILKNKKQILQVIEAEEEKFLKTLEQGEKLADKIFLSKKPINEDKFNELMKNPNKADLIGRIFDKKREGREYSLKEPKLSEKEINEATITPQESFLLFQSYGFPLEMIYELAMAKRLLVSHKDFTLEMQKHQELSRTASAGQFKSGLADNSEATTKLHTATHLLAQALREVLNKPDLHQKGSNITPERLRFDFTFERKLTEQELKKIEDLVNKKIQQGLDVEVTEMTPEQARKQGAQGVFDNKYGEKVRVYSIGDFSKEICAGPHIKNLKELGRFKIQSQESVGAGARRIKAVLE
jgi:alanyl-tRNA synthetase